MRISVSSARVLVAGMALAAAPAAAQVTPAPAATPAPTPSPSASQTPATPVTILAPVPAPVPTTAATPVPATVPTPGAEPTHTPAPAQRATPTSRPTPAPSATPSPTPTPAPSPTLTPTDVAPIQASTPATAASPTPAATASPARAADEVDGGWLLPAGIVAVVLIGGLWFLLRRRRGDEDEEPEAEVYPAAAEAAAPLPAPAIQPPAAPEPRAALEVSFRPIRAGLNLLSATAECELVVRNVGEGTAEEVRLSVKLFSAHAGLDGELAAFYAQPGARPAVPAFALAPGEERRVVTVAPLARAAIHELSAGGRPMFVPTVAVHVAWRDGEAGGGETTAAWGIGIERVDSPKLAPFWLDTPPKLFDAVTARPYVRQRG